MQDVIIDLLIRTTAATCVVKDVLASVLRKFVRENYEGL